VFHLTNDTKLHNRVLHLRGQCAQNIKI